MTAPSQTTLPLVSVVVPCFNYGRYVGAAIEHALNQDWPAMEVIAVDDGSTDDSLAVLNSFGSAIRVIRRENGGVNAATDTGVAAARGELITFLDADDTWPEGRVRLLAQALLAHPEAGAVYGDMRVLDEDGAIVHPSFNAHKGFPTAPSGRFLGQILAFNCVSAGAMMVRSTLRDRFHPIPSHAGWHDWWIATQILRETEILAVPDIVNLYRQHGSNQNMGADEERAVGLLRTELPFRRWVIVNTAPPLVTIRDLLQALAALDWALARIAQFDRVPPHAVVAEDRAAAEGAFQAGHELICAGESESGLSKIIAAAAHAPAWEPPRALLREAIAALGNGPATRPTARTDVQTVPGHVGRAVRTISPHDRTVAPEQTSPLRVSVIIPCFNYGRYLPEAVQSTLASSLRQIEIIIVDDGSTDDSREVAQRLIDDHPEAAIQLIVQRNCGAPGQVRNVGIARARGEYILCLDADDKLHPDFLRACAAALDAAPQAGIAYADFQMFGESDTLQQPPPSWNSRVECDCNFVGTASMFRRRAWEQVGGYETDLAMVGYEDWDFWVGCVEQGWSGVKASDALWYYRVHGGSIYSTHVRRDQELKARIVLKHPSLYCEDQRRWATAILAGDPHASQTGTRVGWMPVFVAAPQLSPARTPAGIAGARRTAVMAFADELVSDPALLHRWAETFDARDEVTLVIHAPGWTLEEADARLSPLVAQAGLDGDDAADLLALALPASAETEAQLAAGAHAILSRRPSRAPFHGLPTVDVVSMSKLRETLAAAR